MIYLRLLYHWLRSGHRPVEHDGKWFFVVSRDEHRAIAWNDGQWDLC